MQLENLPTEEELNQYLSLFGENPYIQAAVVILFSFAIAKLTDILVNRGLAKLVDRTRSELDNKILRILHGPIFTTVLLLGFRIALGLVTPETDSPVEEVGADIIKTLVVIVWLFFFVRASVLLLGYMSSHPRRFGVVQPTTRPLFEIAAKLLLIALGIYFILISWGVNPTGWLASAGIVAVAVGLAAQETLGNLFAGISILADAPYKVGDYVVLDQKDRGRVTRIGLRSTRILTRDDIEITVPNSMIASSKVINESGGPWIKQRLRLPVGVAYGSDPDQVKSVLLEVAESNENVVKTPQPWVQFSGFGDSSLNFELRCWIEDPAKRGRITDQLNTEVYKVLGRNRIEIPFPKRDLYIKELPESLLAQSEGMDEERPAGTGQENPLPGIPSESAPKE